MSVTSFPLEKIFGSRTRVKVIALFATGVKRPYYVREIARHVGERLNAVRRELDILRKIGMLETYDDKRRKYYVVNPNFALLTELASIMQKAGPGIEDVLFKQVEKLGDVRYACASGFFSGATDSPTDLLIVGNLDEERLSIFIKRIEKQLQREITYTPMTESEYRYRRNFNDMFLRQIFMHPHKELINKLDTQEQPNTPSSRHAASIIRPTS
jgi:DNA-binding transcriptional ArsR family regulator